MGIFSTKNKFKMDALRIKERGSKDTPTNFSEQAVAFMKGMPGYYPKFTGGGGEGEIDESKIQNIKVVEGDGGRKLYGEILGDKKFVGKQDDDIYKILQKEIDSGLAKEKYGFEGTDVKEYEKIKLQQMKGPDVEQEKIEVEKEIVDDTSGTTKKDIKEVERTKRFFEDFENEFEIDGERGENNRLNIPVKFSMGKVDFTDKSTMDYFMGPGQNTVVGLNDMLSKIKNAVGRRIVENASDRDRQLYQMFPDRVKTKIKRKLIGLLDIGPNDARALGHKDPLFAIVSMYANNPDKLQQVLSELGLTQQAGTVKEQQEIESSTPGTEGYETDWRQRRD